MQIFEILNTGLNLTSQIILIGGLGLIFGSFASLISHRLATDEPMTFARSKCTKCNAPLKPQNLIPLFSWIFQRGKCGKCGNKISFRYPLIELTFAIFFLIVFFALGATFDLRLILFCLITGTLIVMSVVDLEHYFIPNSTQYFLALIVIILKVMDGGTYGAVDNIKAGFYYVGFGMCLLTFFYFTTKMEAIGIDDIKFFFIAGLMLGEEGFLFFMFLNGFLGAVFGAIWQSVKRESTFPFAPAICVAFFVSMLYGHEVDLIKTIGDIIF